MVSTQPAELCKVLAKVVVFCFVIVEGEVLLIKRATEPCFGELTVPGGHVHKGEALQEACKRELLEETGYKPSGLSFAGMMYMRENDFTEHTYLSVYYTASGVEGALASSPEGEVFWANLEDVLQHTLPAVNQSNATGQYNGTSQYNGTGQYNSALLQILPLIMAKKLPFEMVMEKDQAGLISYKLME